jgi:hypothetical protein
MRYFVAYIAHLASIHQIRLNIGLKQIPKRVIFFREEEVKGLCTVIGREYLHIRRKLSCIFGALGLNIG